MPSDLPSLHSLRLPELRELLQQRGLPRFRAEQLFSWVHGHGVTTTDEMTNISKQLRAELGEAFDFAPLTVDKQLKSEDGTCKLRLACKDGAQIETVLIPHEDRLTQCVSSQVGCAYGCRFCATGTMGFVRQLTPGEIVDQVYRVRALLPELVPQHDRISNLVFMGMGEPLANLDNVLAAVEILCTDIGANFSPRRITISTVGLVPGIRKLGEQMPRVGLAVSLHATTDAVRDELVPLNKRYNLSELMAALRAYPLPRRRRITFEYLLIAGLNDTSADAKLLPRLLDRIPAKINLLPYNPGPQQRKQRWRRPSDASIEQFAEALRAKGLHTTVRLSRGQDISAACGQLVTGRRRGKEENR